MALTFLQAIMLARLFGPIAYGIFAFATSVLSLLTLACTFGTDVLAMREFAGLKDAPEVSQHWMLVLNTSKWLSGMAIIVALISVFTWYAYSGKFGPYGVTTIVIVGALPVAILRRTIESVSVGAKRIIASMMGTQIMLPLSTICCAGLLKLLPFARSSITIGIIFVISSMVSLLTAIAMNARHLPNWFPGRLWPSASLNGSLARAAFNLALFSSGFIILGNVDVLAMGVFGTPKDVAIIRICSRLAEVMYAMRVVLNLQYRPLLAEAYIKGTKADLQAISLRLTKLFVLSTIFPFLFMLIFPRFVLAIFGTGYVGNENVLRIWLIGFMLSTLFGEAGTVLSMCKHEAPAARALWTAVSINLFLDLILIPAFGPMGCAIANSASVIALAFNLAHLAKLKENILTSIFNKDFYGSFGKSQHP